MSHDPHPQSVAMLDWGVQYSSRGVGDPVSAPDAKVILQQWEDESFATRSEDEFLLSWNSVYALVESGRYGDVLHAMGIPPIDPCVPRLVSRGSLTDADFAVRLSEWYREDGALIEGVTQVGACMKRHGIKSLMPHSSWRVVAAVDAFEQRGAAARDAISQRLAWGEIRRLALAAGAHLDTFLRDSIVLAPDKLQIELRKSERTKTKLVEIMPTFSGAPDDWLQTFDRVGRVQDRYNVRTPEGIVQVVLRTPVKRVLEQIKRLPGRRVAGARAEALLANPFATLGADASQVIDGEQFEQAREEAGLGLDRFSSWVQTDTRGYPTEFGLLIEGDTDGGERVPLTDVEAREFVSQAFDRLKSRLQVLPWRDFEFELLGDTEDQLRVLERVLEERQRPPPPWVLPAVVYDLSRYSERVEGIGVEKPYASVYIAKQEESEGWFPSNTVFVVGLPDDGGELRVPLGAKEIDEAKKRLEEARRNGQSTVTLPGALRPMPVDEAERAIRTMMEAREAMGRGSFDPASAKPERRTRKSLLIKPNIASLDYLERREEVLRDVAGDPQLPEGLRAGVALKKHQLEGLAWLQHLFSQSPDHCRGAVLADDMGLGKTLQLITLMAWVRQRERQTQPALVVAPVALLENWRLEADRFFAPGRLRLVEVYGETLAQHRVPAAEIDEQLRNEGLVRFLRPGWVGDADVVLTTYETLRDHEFSFAEQRWSVLICDEAQKIKNPNALVTRAAKKQNARFRVACTGTPVENTLADLWCLFDFVQPGYLGALNEFGNRYRRPIEAKTDEDRTRIEELRNRISPQIKRRLKRDVAADLPRKIVEESSTRLPMSAQQRSLYGHAIGQFSRREGPGAVTPFRNALGLLHYLRVVCTDPQPYGMTAFKAEPIEEYRRKSPKLDWLLKTLQHVRARDEKALVFCEYRDMQRMIRHYVSEALGYSADIVNGDTTADSRSDASRQKRIAGFQARPGFGVLILSPLAVGFGVNIQAANHVIHFTRTWNPAKEDQATDRAYRIGQSKDVTVYCPVVTAPDFKTFDVKLDELLTRKRALAEDMLNGAGDVAPGDFSVEEVAPGETDTTALRQPLSVDDIDRMEPRYFEAYVAALWRRSGWDQVYLTPASGDGGVDVVALGRAGGELIQCKKSTSPTGLGWEAIKDVVTGEAAFRARHPGVSFERVCVANQAFNSGAREQATLNRVRLVGRSELAELAKVCPLKAFDVEQILYTDWSGRS